MKHNSNYFKKYNKKKYKTEGPINPYEDPLDELNKDIESGFPQENTAHLFEYSPTLGVADMLELENGSTLGTAQAQKELDDKYAKGLITEEEYNRESQKLFDPLYDKNPVSSTTDKEAKEDENKNDITKYLQGLGRGVSLETALFSLGQSLAYDGENKDANLLRGVGAAGKTLLAGSRNLLSGYGFQNRSQETMRTFEDRVAQDRRSNYEYYEEGGEVPQNEITVYKDGGVVYRGERFIGYNKPKRTSNHPTKSHAVLAKEGDEIKLIRFGQQGVKGAGSNPKTEKEKARRRAFKARHADNIKKGKMSAAYWSSVTKWENGGEFIDPNTNLPVEPVSLEEEALFIERGLQKEQEPSKLSLEETLVSEKITGNREREGNAELEKGEYLMYPEGDIQEVVGDEHDEGGEVLNLPEGTRILSNALTVGNKLSKQLEEEFDIKVSPKDTYAKAVSKYTDKVGLTKLTKDQEFLIKKLKDLDKDSPSYKVNSEYIEGRLVDIEERRDNLNEKRKSVFGLLFSEQEKSKPNEGNNTPVFENGGEKTPEQRRLIASGALEIIDGKLVSKNTGEVITSNSDKFGISFSENRFSDSDEFKRLHQSATKGGGFGKITKENLEETIKWAYENFPDIASRDDVFGAGYNDKGEFVFNKDIDFTKANDNVRRYQASANARMNSTADDVINNPDLYGREAVIAAQEYKTNQTFDGSLAREVEDGLWGNFSSGRFSLKTQVVTPEELQMLRKNNIFSVKDLVNATESGEITLSQGSMDRLNSIKNTMSENSDFGLQTYTPQEIVEETPVVSEDIVDNTANLRRNEQGNFVYLAPDQSLLPPSPIEPHLKVKNRFQRLDPVEIGVERNIQESFRQQNFANEQLKDLPPAQRAAVLSNMTANTQRSINDAITQTNIVNAQNRQRAEEFNIRQAAQEDLAEGQNAMNFERLQLTAKAKTEKDLRDYFAFNRDVQLNNILREQQLSQIDAMSEDYSVDPFGNVYFNPAYETKFGNSGSQAPQPVDPDTEFKMLRNMKLRRDLGVS